MEIDWVEFGKHVKELRELTNLSQRQFEERVGIGGGYMSQLENGKLPSIPKPATLRKIAHGLRISYEQLTGIPDTEMTNKYPGYPLPNPDLDGADVNLLAVKEIDEDDYKWLVAEIKRRRDWLEGRNKKD